MSTPREVRIGQKDGYHGQLVRVRVDEVQLPSGRESVREVVEHPGAVAIVAVTNDDHLLLVRLFRYAANQDLLEIPAGTREPGEDPATTAARELIEETGYEAGSLTEVLTFFPSPGYSTEQITLFYATKCRPVTHNREIDEPAQVEHVALTEVPYLLLPGTSRIADGKTLIGMFWLMRHIADPN